MKGSVKDHDQLLTVAQARAELAIGGVDFTEVWIRMLVGRGQIKSVKQYSSRLIPRSEIKRMIEKRQDSRSRFSK